jgi:hypothetical protein
LFVIDTAGTIWARYFGDIPFANPTEVVRAFVGCARCHHLKRAPALLNLIENPRW